MYVYCTTVVLFLGDSILYGHCSRSVSKHTWKQHKAEWRTNEQTGLQRLWINKVTATICLQQPWFHKKAHREQSAAMMAAVGSGVELYLDTVFGETGAYGTHAEGNDVHGSACRGRRTGPQTSLQLGSAAAETDPEPEQSREQEIDDERSMVKTRQHSSALVSN